MRIGIIGCGEIGALRAAAARQCNFSIAAVSDMDLSRAGNLTARHGGAVFEDWQSLISSNHLDTVLVCTPPHLHKDMCIAALEAGKHVLCEKPLARNVVKSWMLQRERIASLQQDSITVSSPQCRRPTNYFEKDGLAI